MPTYKITDPNTGKTISMTGGNPPSGDSIRKAFTATSTINKPIQPKDTPMTAGGFAQNALSSGANFVGSLGKAAWEVGRRVSVPLMAVDRLITPKENRPTPISDAKSAYNIAQNLPEVGKAIGQDYKEAYTNSEGKFDPVRAIYKDPFRVASDVATVASLGAGTFSKGALLMEAAGKINTASKLTRVANVLSKVESVTDPFMAGAKLLNKTPLGGKLMSKVGEFGDTYAIKSTRIPTQSQAKFEKALAGKKTKFGKTLPEFIEKTGLYGQDVEKVKEFIKPVQDSFDALQTGNVTYKDVLDNFGRKISELSTKEAMRDPTNRAIREYLLNEASSFAKEAGGVRKAPVSLGSLKETRKSIDENTPQGAFAEANKAEASKMKQLGDVYRKTINESAGTTEMGKELSVLYDYMKRLEKAPKGKNTLPVGITTAVLSVPGMVSGNGFIAKLSGIIGANLTAKLLNNPSFIGFLSKTAKNIKNSNDIVNEVLKAYPYLRNVSKLNTFKRGQ